MKAAVIGTMLLVVALTQYCPMCEPRNCTLIGTGLSSCSQCVAGTLLNVTINLPANESAQMPTPTIGVCQPCSQACSACHFEEYSPAGGGLFWTNVCDKCQTGYMFNYSSGGCAALPANCATGTCMGDSCWGIECDSCKSGYSLVQTGDTSWTCYNTGTVALQGQEENGSIVGMAIWVTITTLAVGVLVALYMRERRKNGQPLILNPTSEKRVSF